MFSNKHSSVSKFTPLKEEFSINSNCESSLDQSMKGNPNSKVEQQIQSAMETICTTLSSPSIQQSPLSSVADGYDQNHNHSKNINNIINLSDNLDHLRNPNKLPLTITPSTCSSLTVMNDDRQFKEPLTKPDPEPDSTGLTLKVIIGAFVAFCTGSFASGYNIGVLNTPEQILKTFFNNSLNSNRTEPMDEKQIELIWSIAVSILVVGALVTSIITGYFANIMGRRGVIFMNVTIGLLAMFLTWSSKYLSNVPMFMAGRLVAGFHTGIASSIVPMYLLEISPKSSASSIGTLHVMGLNGGIFVAQFLGLESLLGTSSTWQLLFFVNAVFITVGLIGLYFMPESPVYLFVVKKREAETIRVLQQIRKDPMEINDDMANLRREQKALEGSNSSFIQLLKQSGFRKSLLIVCFLHAGQQLVGINAVFYYSTNTFRSVGLSQIHSQYGSIGCSLLNTLCAILASRLLTRFSQRTMILISTIGTTLALFVLPISMTFNHVFEWLNYVTIFTMYFYVFMFAIGQGPIPFMIGGLLFDSSSMSIGLSCGCFVNWFCNFLVAFAFPLLVIYINKLVFLIFFGFDVLLMIFILIKVPKTEK